MNRRRSRKLLVASIGVAAVNYCACGNNVTANIAVPPDGSQDGTMQDAPLANLAQPPPDSGLDAKDANPTDAPNDATDAADAKG